MRRLLILLTLLIATSLAAFERQPSADYKARRQRAAEKLGENGVLLLFAAVESPEELRLTFRQDDDFYYLTGFREPGGALLISGKPYREILFLPQNNTQQERWTGKRLGPADPDAAAVTGFDRVEVLDHLHDELGKILAVGRMTIYSDRENKGPVEWLRRVNAFLGAGGEGDARKLVNELRWIKDPGEQALIRKASDATVAAHIAAMRSARAGLTETQLAGIMVGTFMRGGCEAPAYLPIVGSGFNSTVLHYGENSGTLKSGDVIVMDVGGEYSMYATDVTRTIPVDGKFTARQREIYEIVLGAQQAAEKAFQAGVSTMGRTTPNSMFKIAMDYINAHGKDSKGEPLGKYFIHGLGHPVGLNVHDPGDPTKPMAAGMVFTIEPGIYIPEEKLGVRIEDTYLVGQDGKLVCLSCGVPKNPDEVERMMSSR
jgi:Xaa-Pro aminopeptidase